MQYTRAVHVLSTRMRLWRGIVCGCSETALLLLSSPPSSLLPTRLPSGLQIYSAVNRQPWNNEIWHLDYTDHTIRVSGNGAVCLYYDGLFEGAQIKVRDYQAITKSTCQ